VFRCIGTIPEIKERYGGGFNLFIKFKRPEMHKLTDLYANSGWESILPLT